MAIAGSFGAIGAAISGIATVVGTVLQVQTMMMNASIEEENAKRSIERAVVEQQESDLQARGMLGEQLVAQAASGVDTGGVSARATRLAAREAARMDALNIRQAGELEAYNHKAAAASLKMQAGVTAVEGISGALGSFLNMGSSIGNAKPVAKKSYYPAVPTPKAKILS